MFFPVFSAPSSLSYSPPFLPLFRIFTRLEVATQIQLMDLWERRLLAQYGENICSYQTRSPGSKYTKIVFSADPPSPRRKHISGAFRAKRTCLSAGKRHHISVKRNLRIEANVECTVCYRVAY